MHSMLYKYGGDFSEIEVVPLRGYCIWVFYNNRNIIFILSNIRERVLHRAYVFSHRFKYGAADKFQDDQFEKKYLKKMSTKEKV